MFELNTSVAKYGLRFRKINCHYDVRFAVQGISSVGASADVYSGHCPLDPRRSSLSYPRSALNANLAGRSVQVKASFAHRRRTHTKAFETYALELCRHMTIQDVARHLGVNWNVIKDIQKRYLKKSFSHPKLRNPRLIAIDEITIGE